IILPRPIDLSTGIFALSGRGSKVAKIGNSQSVIFDAALMEPAQPHPRPGARPPRCPSSKRRLRSGWPRLKCLMFITGLGTATPARCYTQKECWEAAQAVVEFSRLRAFLETTRGAGFREKAG